MSKNIDIISENAKRKKDEKKNKKNKIKKELSSAIMSNRDIPTKKIKQSFNLDGFAFVTDKLIFRLVNDLNIPVEECHIKNKYDMTYTDIRSAVAKGIKFNIIYKDNVLTNIVDIIISEKDLVYVVKIANKESTDKYVDKFGEHSLKKKKSIFVDEIKYIKI